MTSKKDLIQSHAGAVGKPDKSTDVSSRSTELEEILNNLGHAIADSHRQLDDNFKEIGSRAQELKDQAGDAKMQLCEDEADVFGAIEDQMADLAQRAESAGETSGLPVDHEADPDRLSGGEAELDDGAVSGAAEVKSDDESNLDLEWDQKAADELARIYKVMEGSVAEFDAMGDQVVRDPAENHSAIISTDEDDHVESDQLAGAGFESDATMAMADGDNYAGAGDPENAELTSDALDIIDPRLVIETFGAFDQSIDDAGAENVAEAISIEDRFAEIALRIEQALGAEKDDISLRAIENRFDLLEEKMSMAIRHPEDSEAIRALELQMADLSRQFQQTETQISRIATIEQNIEYLIQEVEKSRPADGAVLAAMPQDGEGGASLLQVTVAHGDRIEKLRDVLEDYILDRREGDQLTVGALSSIQSGINSIANQIAPVAGSLVAEAVEVEVEDEEVDVAVADEMDYGLAPQVQPAAENPELNAHGPAQAEFADEAASAECGVIDDEEELALGHIDDAPAAPIADSVDETSAEDISATLQIDAEISEQDIEVAAPKQPTSARDDMIKAARDAASSVATRDGSEREDSQKGSRAKDFLASARDAAKAAAERVAREEAELEKRSKKKRGLFSLSRNAAHPVLIGATLLLTATTAGLVYSQIKDHPVNHLAAHVRVQTVQENTVEPKIDPVVLTNPKAAKLDARISPSAIVHPISARVGHADRLLIDEVPHHRASDDISMDVPVGIVVNEPQIKPNLKQIAAMQRRQALAKMSSDLTNDGASLSATEIALRPRGASLPENKATQKSKVPTLALPPAAIGPFSLRVAAAKGDAGSQFEVATRYAQGRGIKRDYGQAIKWYNRAAAQGHAIAQYRLAALYEKGHGVTKDLGRARIWYRRSAEKGNIKAMHNLAVLYTGRSGRHPDYPTAVQWFKMAAERGLADSQFNLAILYANGLGVKRSKTEAYKWFSLASSRGDKEALKRLTALKTSMSGSEISSASGLVEKWQGKPAVSGANSAREAALQLKKSGLNVDQSARQLIAQAQALLGKLGYRPGPADGHMGPKTRDAISTFEKRSGMKVTGTVTPRLISRLSGLAS